MPIKRTPAPWIFTAGKGFEILGQGIDPATGQEEYTMGWQAAAHKKAPPEGGA